MAQTVELRTRKIDIAETVDVLVCGGGTAGFAAAAAAARAGAETIVIEQLGCLGGLGTSGLVPCFCPYTDGEKPVARGIAEEVLVELARRMGVEVEYDWFNIHAEMLKKLFDDMLADCGARVRFFTKIVDVVASEGHIEAVVISTHEGLKALKAGVFIDASGDGDVAAWAGAPFEVGDGEGRMQAPTLCNLFANVDWAEFWRHKEDGEMRPDQKLWRAHCAEGSAPIDEWHLAAGVLPCGPSIGASNAGHIYEVNCLDEAALTQAIIEGRDQAWAFLEWYRANVPGFQKAELAETGAILGVRETRRILGDYVLNFEDYKARRSFEDEIGRFAFPVDIHSSTSEDRARQFAEKRYRETQLGRGESYGIPYRCLITEQTENMLMAGRCISTDRHLQGSLRVMPACFITGQAAGVAASMAAKKPGGAVREIDTTRLRETLTGQGAYLP